MSRIEDALKKPLECGTCTACCKAFVVDITRQEAKRLKSSKIKKDQMAYMNGNRVKRGLQTDNRNRYKIKTRNGGYECVYCTGSGCSIYKRRPKACVDFDCRTYALLHTFGQDKETNDVVEIGRKKLIDEGVTPSDIVNFLADYMMILLLKDEDLKAIEIDAEMIDNIAKEKGVREMLMDMDFQLDDIANMMLCADVTDEKAMSYVEKMFTVWSLMRYKAGKVHPNNLEPILTNEAA